MKITTLLIMVLMMALLALPLAAAFPVEISYSPPADGKPVVADVPFPLTVYMNTAGQGVLSYNLYVTSSDGKPVFTSASKGTLFPDNLILQNTALENGVLYRYQVQPHATYIATSSTHNSLFILTTRIPGMIATSTQLKRNAAGSIHPDNVITPAATGATVEIADLPQAVTPALSACNDGIIGYIDADQDGVKGSMEKDEVCDTAVSGGAQGCGAGTAEAAACTYINLGWQCTNTQFGSRNSACTKLTPQQFFLGKVTALINAECYPDCTHPQGLYKTVDAAGNAVPALQYDANGKLTLQQKIYLIGQLSTALREFLAEIIVQP